MDGEEMNDDAFSEENLRVVNFILLGRIYDVLMGLLTEANSSAAADLLELHAGGSLLGPSPSFNGAFITDLMNAQDNTDTQGVDQEPTGSASK